MEFDDDKESGKFEKDIFGINKYLLTLSMTVFGSSIALAIDKQTNLIFLLGELLIFISSILGLLLVWGYKKNIDLNYLNCCGESKKINSAKKRNSSGIYYLIFKKVKYNRLESFFLPTLILGMFFVLISLFFKSKMGSSQCFIYFFN